MRFRRSLFPGYSDTFEYQVPCLLPGVRRSALEKGGPGQPDHHDVAMPPLEVGRYRVEAVLNYRKVDQFLLNYILGEKPGLTAPVVHVARVVAWLDVAPPTPEGRPVVRLVLEASRGGE